MEQNTPMQLALTWRMENIVKIQCFIFLPCRGRFLNAFPVRWILVTPFHTKRPFVTLLRTNRGPLQLLQVIDKKKSTGHRGEGGAGQIVQAPRRIYRPWPVGRCQFRDLDSVKCFMKRRIAVCQAKSYSLVIQYSLLLLYKLHQNVTCQIFSRCSEMLPQGRKREGGRKRSQGQFPTWPCNLKTLCKMSFSLRPYHWYG